MRVFLPGHKRGAYAPGALAIDCDISSSPKCKSLSNVHYNKTLHFILIQYRKWSILCFAFGQCTVYHILIKFLISLSTLLVFA